MYQTNYRNYTEWHESLSNELRNFHMKLNVKFTTSFQSSRFDWQLRNEIAQFVANFRNFKGTSETVCQKFCEMHCNTDLKIGRICKISLDGCYSVSAFWGIPGLQPTCRWRTSSSICLPPILNHTVFWNFIQVNVIIYLDTCLQGQMADLFFSKSKLSVVVPFIVFTPQKYTVKFQK